MSSVFTHVLAAMAGAFAGAVAMAMMHVAKADDQQRGYNALPEVGPLEIVVPARRIDDDAQRSWSQADVICDLLEKAERR